MNKSKWMLTAALAGCLALAACTNESVTEPDEPSPAEQETLPGELNANDPVANNESEEPVMEVPEEPNEEPPAEQENTDPSNATEEPGENSEVPEDHGDSGEVDYDYDADAILAQLEGGVVIGSSEETVDAVLGSSRRDVQSLLTGESAWRYDLGVLEGYAYEDDTDVADMDGLAAGEIHLQVFVYFDEENLVSGYSAYENDNGSVMAHHLFADGTRKTEDMS